MHRELQRAGLLSLRRLVFMSGGAFTPSLQTFFDQPSIVRLNKPLFPRAIAEVLQRIVTLGERRAA